MREDTVGGCLGGSLIYIIYLGITLVLGWWSIRLVIWFFTGGDFPLPWQPF